MDPVYEHIIHYSWRVKNLIYLKKLANLSDKVLDYFNIMC